MIYTWQGSATTSLESVRLVAAEGRVVRASGRFIAAADPRAGTEAFNASFDLTAGKPLSDGRLLIRATTGTEERQLSASRTDEGQWLVDRGAGSERNAFDGAMDLDVAGCVLFNSLPIRRLGLHREAAEHELAVVYLSLPDLSVSLARQTYRTVSIDPAGGAVVEFRQGDFTAELTVDADGVVVDYPGVATRI